jgi:aspartyl-tRNA synthetase
MSVQPASELSGSSIADDVRELRHLEFGRIPDAARLMLVSVRSDVSDLTGVDLSAVRILRGRTEVVLAESRPAMSIVILEPAFFAAAPAQQRYVAVHEMFHAVWTLGSFRFISDFPATAAAYSELLDGLESGGGPLRNGNPGIQVVPSSARLLLLLHKLGGVGQRSRHTFGLIPCSGATGSRSTTRMVGHGH